MAKLSYDKKFLIKHQAALQAFYDKAIVDPEVQKAIQEAGKYSEMSPEFHNALDVLYSTMEKMFREELNNSINKGKTT